MDCETLAVQTMQLSVTFNVKLLAARWPYDATDVENHAVPGQVCVRTRRLAKSNLYSSHRRHRQLTPMRDISVIVICTGTA